MRTTSEARLTRLTADGVRVTLRMDGVVETRMRELRTRLTPVAFESFGGWVGILEWSEVEAFVKALNWAFGRKTGMPTDAVRLECAFRRMGLPQTPGDAMLCDALARRRWERTKEEILHDRRIRRPAVCS